MNKKLKKIILSIVIIIAILAHFVLVFEFLFVGFDYYDNDIDCINSKWSSLYNTSDSYVNSTIIFKYENNSQELFVVEDSKGEQWVGHLKKIKIGNKCYYGFREMGMYSTYYSPLTNEWKREGKFKYIFLEDKKDIENFDCKNKEPICTEIDYTSNSGHNLKGYMFVLD